jgi:V/A-type H+-transporting ATPase subunit A
VTQHTKRFTSVFWALDKELADARHYPAINWMQSYSGFLSELTEWWISNVSEEWRDYRDEAMRILQREDELNEIVKLVGPDALPDRQRLILETAKILRNVFLQQNALDPIDTYCLPVKQFKMLKIVIDFHHLAEHIIDKGAPLFKVINLSVLPEIMRMKEIPNEQLQRMDELSKKMWYQFSELEKGAV